jgi:hypothetical protein
VNRVAKQNLLQFAILFASLAVILLGYEARDSASPKNTPMGVHAVSTKAASKQQHQPCPDALGGLDKVKDTAHAKSVLADMQDGVRKLTERGGLAAVVAKAKRRRRAVWRV